MLGTSKRETSNEDESIEKSSELIRLFAKGAVLQNWIASAMATTNIQTMASDSLTFLKARFIVLYLSIGRSRGFIAAEDVLSHCSRFKTGGLRWLEGVKARLRWIWLYFTCQVIFVTLQVRLLSAAQISFNNANGCQN